MTITNLVVNGVNLKRGQKILMSLPDEFTSEEVNEIKNGLEALCPGVEFILICGATVIGAYDTLPGLLELESDA